METTTMKLSEADLSEALQSLDDRFNERILHRRIGFYGEPRRQFVHAIRDSISRSEYEVPAEDVARVILIHCILT
jgi:hypothetical protein